MEPINWLGRKFPGYATIDEFERQVICDFFFLWSFFEGKFLNKSASIPEIENWTHQLEAARRLNRAPFERAIEHFRRRYFFAGQLNELFDNLKVNAKHRKYVTDVLSSAKDTDYHVTTGLLIIVYRLRNNLFHGAKWEYDIKYQMENLQQSNAVLIAAMDL